MSLAVLP